MTVHFLLVELGYDVGAGTDPLSEGLGQPWKHLNVDVGVSKVVKVVAVWLHQFIISGKAVTHLGSRHEAVGTGLSVKEHVLMHLVAGPLSLQLGVSIVYGLLGGGGDGRGGSGSGSGSGMGSGLGFGSRLGFGSGLGIGSGSGFDIVGRGGFTVLAGGGGGFSVFVGGGGFSAFPGGGGGFSVFLGGGSGFSVFLGGGRGTFVVIAFE
ncbi:hypothetical protein K432DRAFT_411014 [Lepidopterella palustris CBS 459.81]|uniref:Uncharacterized protein n=1 Tax=Lepidopterella palustris CBS 459.81 TaxID=1314670 RepID=A0A8E2J8C7_9PEZI|nr:hypothetical protein K432DRAFT_411014 [Lepidopterella palustris CBS 459.81]